MLIDFSRFQVSRTVSGESFFNPAAVDPCNTISFHMFSLLDACNWVLLKPAEPLSVGSQQTAVFVDVCGLQALIFYTVGDHSSLMAGRHRMVGIGQWSDRDPSQVVPTMICLELGLLFLSVRLLSTS